jgi:hypothetical protein
VEFASLARALGTEAVGFVAFSLLPIGVFAVVEAVITWPMRIAWAIGYAALAAAAISLSNDALHALSMASLAFCYYFAAAWVFVVGLRRVAGLARHRGLLGATCAGVFLLLPASLLHNPWTMSFLVFGWAMALSAYSYGIDTGRAREAPDTRAGMIFLLVDPTLVFVDRARLQLPAVGHGVLRAAFGALAVLGGWMLCKPALLSLQPAGEAAPVRMWLLTGGLSFLYMYANHSGVASLRIGLLGTLGYRVAERYNYPWLARDPVDFWRRWNTYVARWASRYIFYPTTLGVARRYRSFPHAGSYLCALLLTFCIIGALHDLYGYADSGAVQARGMLWFACAGAYVAAWVGVDRALRRARWSLGKTLRWTGALLGRVVFAAVALTFIGAWAG